MTVFLGVAGTAVVMAYFLWFAGSGASSYFGHDDLMNMNQAVKTGPVWKNLVRSVLFFLPAQRPMGAVLYRFTYDVAGFHPRLLHVLCTCIALLNLGLLFLVIAKMSGSREIGLLAALLGAYHGNCKPLFFDTGTCYDLLSFLFFYAALWLYCSARERRQIPGGFQFAGILFLFVLAIAAKEIALSFPLVLIVYELVWDPPGKIAELPAWMYKQGRLALCCALIAAIFTLVRVYGPEGLASIDAYRPHFTLTAYLTALGVSMDDLFYRGRTFTPAYTALAWSALIAMAALWRSRTLIFFIALTLAGFLPIAFVTPRGLAASYVPWVGFWGFTAGVLVYARKYLAAKLGNGEATVLASQIALFCIATTLLAQVHTKYYDPIWVTNEEDEVRHVTKNLEEMHLVLPSAARVLIVKDPFPKQPFSSFFLLRLYYHDPEIQVYKCSQPKPDAPAGYDAILTYQDDRWSTGRGCAP